MFNRSQLGYLQSSVKGNDRCLASKGCRFHLKLYRLKSELIYEQVRK